MNDKNINYSNDVLYSIGQIPEDAIDINPYKSIKDVTRLVRTAQAKRIQREHIENRKKARANLHQSPLHQALKVPTQHIIYEGNSSGKLLYVNFNHISKDSYAIYIEFINRITGIL